MIKPRIYKPDFCQLEKVLKKEIPNRPVLFEYFINADVISYFNQFDFNKIINPEDKITAIINFFYKAGYDYATIPSRYFSSFTFETVVKEKKSTISLNEGFSITNRESFDKNLWPDPESRNTELLKYIEKVLPEGMKIIISSPGGLLENVISLVGFENLCFMIYEDEELVTDIFNTVGARLLRFYSLNSTFDYVGAMIVNDDWGFKTQTMFSPETLQKFVFPWHKLIVEAIHKNNKFAILHSCGNLSAVFDNIIDELKYDAKHSFEDEIESVESAWEIWHNRIAIMGGIDIDFLVRSNTEEISKRSKNIIKKTGCKSYALGSGNSIPTYIPLNNYLSMIESIF